MGHTLPAAHTNTGIVKENEGQDVLVVGVNVALNFNTRLRNNTDSIPYCESMNNIKNCVKCVISDLFCVCVSHQPRPVDDPVQPQSDEDELKNVN